MTEDGYGVPRSNLPERTNVGKIASIDRGWLHGDADVDQQQTRVGKIASIDRGWLHTISMIDWTEAPRGENSLD